MATNNPCVKNCCLNQQNVCLGCFRTLEEILAWHDYSEDDTKVAMLKCEKRKTAYYVRFPQAFKVR